MSATYCSTCGAQRVPGASFCASCGTALAAPTAEQPAAPAADAWGAAPQQATPAAPAYPAAQYTPPPVPQPEQAQQPAAQPPYAPPQPQPQPQWTAPAPQAAPPAAAPWGAAAPTAPAAARQPGRSLVDALLTGDWGGAARTAGIAVGSMLAVSLVGTLLVTEGGVGFRETLALIFAGVCLAVGGDAFAEAEVESFGSSMSLGVLPLTVTVVGLGLLGWLFATQLRRLGGVSATDRLLQGVRTALVFTACFLPLALLTRYSAEETALVQFGSRIGVGVLTSVLGALLFAVAALGLAWLFSRSTVLPGRVGVIRDKSRAPLAGALAVFSVGLLAVVAALVYGLVEESDPAIQIGVAVLAAGNGALASVLLSAGVPLNVEGSASAGMLGEFAPGSQSVDLFTFTDGSGWFWLAPVFLLAATVLVAAALAVRQNTVEDARREGARFAGALAAVAFVATLLLRIAMEGGANEFSAAAEASVTFNPIMAAFVLGIWGAVTGLLAPVVAAKLPSGFVVAVRNRFGAAEPTAPVA